MTDDELILFDVLFDVRISFQHLRRVHFAVQHNRPSHSLDDPQLRETLDRFCMQGFLTMDPPHPEPGLKAYGEWFEITPLGGEAWQSERTPVWERFVSGRQRPMRSGKEIVSRSGVSAQVFRESLQLYWDYFGQGKKLTGLRQFLMKRNHILSWKSFATIYLVAGIADGDPSIEEYMRRDWKLYESLRTSWSTVQQLQKFVGPGRKG